jgi:hypothetical protein
MPLRLAILSAAILLAVTSIGTAATASPAEIPACPLLTADEVSAAFGQPLVAAEQEATGGGDGQGRRTTCLWTPAEGRLGPTLSVMVWSWPPGGSSAEGYMDAFVAVAEQFPDLPAPEPLEIGDEALWDGNSFHLRKGDVTVTLGTSLNALDDTPDARAKLEDVAKIIAGRL